MRLRIKTELDDAHKVTQDQRRRLPSLAVFRSVRILVCLFHSSDLYPLGHRSSPALALTCAPTVGLLHMLAQGRLKLVYLVHLVHPVYLVKQSRSSRRLRQAKAPRESSTNPPPQWAFCIIHGQNQFVVSERTRELLMGQVASPKRTKQLGLDMNQRARGPNGEFSKLMAAFKANLSREERLDWFHELDKFAPMRSTCFSL